MISPIVDNSASGAFHYVAEGRGFRNLTETWNEQTQCASRIIARRYQARAETSYCYLKVKVCRGLRGACWLPTRSEIQEEPRLLVNSEKVCVKTLAVIISSSRPNE